MNVLKITSTPIKLSMTSQRARLESRLPDPEVGIIRNPGKLNMKSDHIKVDIDTSRSRDSRVQDRQRAYEGYRQRRP